MPNKITGIMLAAANMAADQVYHDIHARARWPYRAEAPEYGLDVPRIYKEAREANKLTLIKGLIVLLATLFARYSLILAFIALVAIQFEFRRRMRARVRDALTAVVDEPAPDAQQPEPGNVLISGGYAPFLGSGRNLRSWSFTVDLSKPANEAKAVEDLDARQLYVETQDAIERLQLPHLEFRDVVCVDGRDVAEPGILLPGGPHSRPLTWLPSAAIDGLIGSNDSGMRHYKQLQIDLWGGQMIIGMFHRYTINGTLLYVEVRFHVLTPLKQQFLDHERLPFEHDLVKEIGRCILAAPFLWIGALTNLSKTAAGAIQELIDAPEHANRRAIDADRRFNYGWERSLREHWSGGVYERYFQESDLDFYEKSIKDAFLESLLRSFKARNISTAAFEQASSIIYNEGIIVSGGTVQTESMAAGKGAQATVQKVLNAAQAARTTTTTTS